MLDKLKQKIENIPGYKVIGRVTSVKGLLITCIGIADFASIGSQCKLYTKHNKEIVAEVIAVDHENALLMSFQHLLNVGVGCKVELITKFNVIHPDNSWLGRVLNARGKPLDNKGNLLIGDIEYDLNSVPPNSYERRLTYKKLDLGVKSINVFAPCCYGQRMGIFAGSGIGKSVLLSMIAKFSVADIKVIGLVGERGKEVQQFLQEYLCEGGLNNTVLIVATSDESALMRKRAALLTMTIAEYFRDRGAEVLCLIDSITRFAMSQREIGLCIGEMQTMKGYTPTVFSEMSKLLERAGTGKEKQGNITGIFSVLVENDDSNDPISDSVRSILDGHVILDRDIAERGRFPAVNVLKSISRSLPNCNHDNENKLVKKARKLLTNYNEMEDMIKLGAYKKGIDKETDQAINYYPLLENFLAQRIDEQINIEQSYQALEKILQDVN
ncbi:MAG: flagellar protein export ATPase FliI [Rickettsiaceae bacterium H1]|nr:flagellar protein export ATPase FliI [Rickettsiaceae bacterium H1]